MNSNEWLIVALDVPTMEKALQLVQLLKDIVRIVKVGSQLYTACGPRIVQMIRSFGVEVFLDLKFHDIPNTVAGAAAEATKLGVRMFNVHCLGGFEMMKAAAEAVKQAAMEAAGTTVPEQSLVIVPPRPLVLGVTILTSHDFKSLHRLGLVEDCPPLFAFPGSVDEFRSKQIQRRVLQLAGDAKEAGLDGVVASPDEIRSIREACGPDFLIVTPGIRLVGAEKQDQARVNTPAAAIRADANYIVVGRPILQAADPVAAAQRIIEEIAQVM